MKHRHTFFLLENTEPPPDALTPIPKTENEPATLLVKHLKAAQEWKATFDPDDLDSSVY